VVVWLPAVVDWAEVELDVDDVMTDEPAEPEPAAGATESAVQAEARNVARNATGQTARVMLDSFSRR
jgi:hypothetical protein